MRRVVITGMGIVSSIGNNVQEVAASLRNATPGIVRADKYAELGFRCQVHGAPTLDPETLVDRRAMRFHGGGTAWNHVGVGAAPSPKGCRPASARQAARYSAPRSNPRVPRPRPSRRGDARKLMWTARALARRPFRASARAAGGLAAESGSRKSALCAWANPGGRAGHWLAKKCRRPCSPV